MSSREDKARGYITSLDVARCNGNWNDLPELIRKVKKHAPHRKCLIKTAVAEKDIATAVSLRLAEPASIANQIPQLVSAIEDEEHSAEEEFQAQTSLGWIYWVLGECESAVERLPKDLPLVIHRLTADGQTISPWTEVCLLKAAYIRVASLISTTDTVSALQTFQSIAAWMEQFREKALAEPQLAYWSEQLLAQVALLSVKEIDFRQQDHSRLIQGLQAFRSWAKFATARKDISSQTYGNSALHLPRLSLWRADYEFLSTILKYGLKEPAGDTGVFKSDQAAEFRRVEIMYENELLRSTSFPEATDSNTVIEQWVEQVIENWQALCARQSSEAILEEGNRNASGRNVLDILYRAAMKTFHSTLILRRLFQVHKSLTEFDLAYRALDTYIELVERGRARASKSGEPSTGQDDDETILETISEGIEGLCCFGGQDEAEKAYQLSEKLEKWLEPLLPESNRTPAVNGNSEGNVEGLSTHKTTISSETLEIVYRAIGTGRAQWARWTPCNEERSSLQAGAVSSLKKAIGQVTGNDHPIESIFALGVLLAEMRDISQAIEHVKKALVWEGSQFPRNPWFTLERKLVPVWHLLALLLTARQDFETAGQTCAAAFEQFSPSSVLFGSTKPLLLSSKTSNAKAFIVDEHQGGIVDGMECDELQRIIEIRITELALTEVMNGPEEAVNKSNELLGLYSRLFGPLGVGGDEKSGPKNLEPLKSSVTTVRSLRGSVFVRKKIDRSDGSADKIRGLDEKSSSRPATRATDAPTIQITDEHGRSPNHKHHLFRHSEDRPTRDSKNSLKGHKREGSISKFIRGHSKDRKQTPEKSLDSSQYQSFDTTQQQSAGDGPAGQPEISPDEGKNRLQPEHTTDEVPIPPTSLTSHSSLQAKHGLQQLDHGSTSKDLEPSRPSGLDDRPLIRETPPSPAHYSSKSKTPAARFPKPAAQKHALTILAKIWLVIATLYRRADLCDDAREACEEAAKAAQRIEALTATVESSARAFANPGWGGTGKSSDEVWADIFCERAEIALAVAYVGEEKEPVEIIDNERVREAVDHFEQCLMFFPNHGGGIVGLSNVLLDFYEKKVDLGKRVDDGRPKQGSRDKPKRSAFKVSNSMQNGTAVSAINVDRRASGNYPPASISASILGQTDDELKKTPENLNRLAARDRAYGLLSTLTKLGTGWDNSKAWFALARAHELGGEIGKAREILWWCVELEDRRPLRHWRNISSGGYVLT